MGIRLVVIDDNPHLAWDGAIHPANATFEHFVAALLDLPGSPVGSITSCVPVREAVSAPAGLALDPRIRVVRTAPFDGIAGYLRHLPSLMRANRPTLARAISGADLVWVKVPASNAALAGAIAVRTGVPRFVWVAGSAADVAAGRFAGARGVGGRVVGAGYDAVGRLVALGGRRLVVGEGVVDGDGVVASLVEPGEVRDPDARAWPPGDPAELADSGQPAAIRLAWAGRLAGGKGLEALIEAVGLDAGLTLDVLGDGPDRDRLRGLGAGSGAGGRITWAGHVADRAAYLDRLGAADVFVFPSPAEGFPKVVLDAFAVGLPVVATRAGALAELADGALVDVLPRPDAASILAALTTLRERAPVVVAADRRRASDFVAAHTRPAEAARVVGHWRRWWPDLPWER
jgi:glycosyltransferase involved in cell wall biosynthesis